ncbi:unnamed protein product [Mytilus edulis]|uniref:Uncharacterized protein n=1 Tax=Mytilus edulis TaxID=6550 RepID=A0A8S3QEK6_MYTED|nr:unnamed protein product [Mytilus edulis]
MFLGCWKGTWGRNCSELCPANCINQNCYPETGLCVWGCDAQNCLNNQCDNKTGVCTDGCEIGQTGQYCNKRRAKVYKRKKQKPKIRSFKTNQASKRCKEAFAKWKANERPTSSNNKIYCDMKFAKYELRKTCRIEIAMKVLNDRQEILDARTKHDQIFYKLLGKKES